MAKAKAGGTYARIIEEIRFYMDMGLELPDAKTAVERKRGFLRRRIDRAWESTTKSK